MNEPETTAEKLRRLADVVGSNAQYEVHQCHYPDAPCVICIAWNELGDLRITLARCLAAEHEALERHGCNVNCFLTGKDDDPDPLRTRPICGKAEALAATEEALATLEGGER